MTDQQAQDIRRGEHARRILEDEMVQGAMSAVKEAIREQMFDLPIGASREREMLALMDKARQQFEGWFAAALQGEHIAKLELEAERKAQSLMERTKEKVRSWAA